MVVEGLRELLLSLLEWVGRGLTRTTVCWVAVEVVIGVLLLLVKLAYFAEYDNTGVALTVGGVGNCCCCGCGCCLCCLSCVKGWF